MFKGTFPRSRRIWTGAGLLVLVLLVAVFVGLRSRGASGPVTVAFSEFLADVEAGRVASVTVTA